MQEFKNSSANLLVMPLPKELERFYRRDNDCQLEFTGENDIGHTPKDETIRLYTGNTFDMTWVRAAAEPPRFMVLYFIFAVGWRSDTGVGFCP